MYYSDSIKVELTTFQKQYLTDLRRELNNLELLGESGSNEWWLVVESIDQIENNL